jgi:hypothetical protein
VPLVKLADSALSLGHDYGRLKNEPLTNHAGLGEDDLALDKDSSLNEPCGNKIAVTSIDSSLAFNGLHESHRASKNRLVDNKLRLTHLSAGLVEREEHKGQIGQPTLASSASMRLVALSTACADEW